MTTPTVKPLPNPSVKTLPSSSVMVLEPSQGSPKRRKGKNFSPEEECSLCRSFLAVSQGPVVENGQKISSMWERVAASFNEKNIALGRAPRSARSLESKWGTIKHDVSIFVGCYASVENSKQLGASEEVIEKALELYRLKHPKGGSFLHLHCWRILHEEPEWCNNGDVATPAKGLGFLEGVVSEVKAVVTQEDDGAAHVVVVEDPPEVSGDDEEPVARSQGDNRVAGVETDPLERQPKRLRRGKVDKEAKARECALRAQARAMADMAAASRMKADILADQSALQLFTLPLSSVTEADAREYLMLRRQEEITKMRRRVLAQTSAPAAAAAVPIDQTFPTPALPPEQSVKQPTTGNWQSLDTALDCSLLVCGANPKPLVLVEDLKGGDFSPVGIEIQSCYVP